MSKLIYKTFTACLIVLMIGAAGCKKAVEIDPPLNEVSSALVFSSDKTAKSALSAMYSSLAQAPTQNLSLTQYSSLQADDLLYLLTNASLQEYMNNTYSRVSTSQASVFSDWYATIYRANAIIEGLQKYTGTTAAVKKQLTAEAKFMRAYCYFNLVNTFGDVPLVLVTDVTVTAFQPRETVANVYKQIVTDLTDAKVNLLSDYSATSGDRIGANKFVAAALLARVSMFTGDYATAESNASEVIASSLYSIIPSATMGTGVFVKNSTESIWQLVPPIAVTNQYTTEGSTFNPSSTAIASFTYRINPNLINVFDNTDLRRTKWMSDTNFSGTIYSIPFKYKYRTNALAVAAGVTEYTVLMRLPEQYLIRAEARARLASNPTGALSDLNVTRLRAGLTASTTTDATTLLNEIALENRKEFFCEQGFRWFNLKRTGQADAVLGALKPTYTPKAKLLPIPQAAIDANPNLTQNPGY